MRVNYIKKEVHLLKRFNMKKIIILLLISVVFSCKSDPVLFELTTSVNPLGSGTVSPDKGTVWLGDQIEFSAEANTGYSFVKWSGDLNDSLSKISLIDSTTFFSNPEYACTIYQFISKNLLLKLN